MSTPWSRFWRRRRKFYALTAKQLTKHNHPAHDTTSRAHVSASFPLDEILFFFYNARKHTGLWLKVEASRRQNDPRKEIKDF